MAIALACTGVALAGIKHDFDRPVFVFMNHPDLPISSFAAGRLGIPEPSHARIYLYAVYRYLEGRPFSEAEQRAYVSVWRLRRQRDWIAPLEAGRREWERIRKGVPVPAPAATGEAKESARLGVRTRGWVYADICADEAFATAAGALGQRIRQFGQRSREVRFWVEGQDQVFRCCDPGQGTLPTPAPADLPPVIRADREYQIAAALLYAQRLDEAYDQFQRIAKDPASPWRTWAPYLMGRTLVWKARLTQEEKAYRDELERAEHQFQAVLADPALKVSHAGAERLLIRCMLITQPVRALERLGRRLNRSDAVASRETDLFAYLNGTDDLLEGTWLKPPKPVAWEARPQDELSQWLSMFQETAGWTYAAALSRWKKGRSKAWLYAALWKAQGGEPEVKELIRAGLSVGLEEPIGPAVRYQVARLLGHRGAFAQAREQVDGVLSRLRDCPSATNRAKQLRLQLATNLQECLELAPRRVVLAAGELETAEFESRERPDLAWVDGQLPEFRDELRKHALERAATARRLARLDRFDAATTAVFNERLSLSVLRSIALTEGSLPEHLLSELRLVTWTRAVLLSRFEVARELGPSLTGLYPEIQPEMRRFLEARDPKAAEVAAALVLLKLPGARPYMSRGYGRQIPVNQHDEWGRNGWYLFTDADMYHVDLPYWCEQQQRYIPYLRGELPNGLLPRLSFLSKEQAAEAAQEWRQLRAKGERGLNWMALRIAESVAREPEQPAAAETLYRVLVAAWVDPWDAPADWELPHPGLEAVRKLLLARYGEEAWQEKIEVLRLWFLGRSEK
jgi:hypothetical protein